MRKEHKINKSCSKEVRVDPYAAVPFDDFLDTIKTLQARKREAYAGVDPFENYRSSAAFAGVPTPRLMLSRVQEKLTRIKNIEAKGLPVDYDDDLLDISIITGLAWLFRQNQKDSISEEESDD